MKCWKLKIKILKIFLLRAPYSPVSSGGGAGGARTRKRARGTAAHTEHRGAWGGGAQRERPAGGRRGKDDPQWDHGRSRRERVWIRVWWDPTVVICLHESQTLENGYKIWMTKAGPLPSRNGPAMEIQEEISVFFAQLLHFWHPIRIFKKKILLEKGQYPKRHNTKS